MQVMEASNGLKDSRLAGAIFTNKNEHLIGECSHVEAVQDVLLPDLDRDVFQLHSIIEAMFKSLF